MSAIESVFQGLGHAASGIAGGLGQAGAALVEMSPANMIMGLLGGGSDSGKDGGSDNGSDGNSDHI